MRRKTLGILSGMMGIGGILGMVSCYAPVDLGEVVYEDAAHGDEYQFDVVMLSEWAGRILPEKSSAVLYYHSSDEKYYFVNEREDNVTKCDAGICMGKEPVDENMLFNKKHDIIDKDLPTTINYSYPSNGKIDCVLDEAFETETPKSDWSRYNCDYTVSGALSLSKVWNAMAGDNLPHIYVGNGDSFGVSQLASSMFEDIPAAEMLSLLGLHVDTFGNHNFDNGTKYLQNIIDFVTKHDRGYKFVATNIQGTQAIEKWLTHYTVTVSGQNADAEDGLRVAFIGALDETVYSTTTTGAFSDVVIDNEMCSIINELELAYNENARAFFILGHILTGRDSYKNLMDALFTFTGNTLSDSVSGETGGAKAFLNQCESKLVVPLARIKKTFGVDSIMDLDFSDQAVKKKYASLIDELRHEIFMGIVGVFGEVSDESSVMAYSLNEWDGNIPEKNILNTSPEYKSCSKTPSLLSLYPSYECAFDVKEEPQTFSNHPIYYIQFPGSGAYTMQLNVTAKKLHDNNGDKLASSYALHVTGLKLLPVFSSLEEAKVNVGNSNSNININLLNPQYDECLSFIDKLVSNSSVSEECSTFYNNIAKGESGSDVKKLYTSIKDVGSAEDKSFYACHEGFASYILDKTDVESRIEQASAFWACLYTDMSKYLCKADDSEKREFYLSEAFVFDKYNYSTTGEDRSQTTFNTNIVAHGFLNYMNASYTHSFDVSLINAGTIREGDYSQLSVLNIPTMIPFSNKLASVSISISNLVKTINSALAKVEDLENNDYGGFPSVSRLAIAYKTTGGAPKIMEVWKTDEFGALETLLYVRNEVIINDDGFFAKYEYKNKKMQASFNGSTWICRKDNSFSDRSDTVEFDMVDNEDDAYVYASNEKEQSLNVLTHSFVISGGDGYRLYFGAKKEDVVQYDDALDFRSAVYNYYNGTDNGTEAEACSKKVNMTTQDQYSPEDMNCILFVNHFYDEKSQKQPKSRWIDGISEDTKRFLDAECSADNLNAILNRQNVQ